MSLHASCFFLNLRLVWQCYWRSEAQSNRNVWMEVKRVMDKDNLQFSNMADHISYHPSNRMTKRGGLYTSRLGCGQPTDPVAQFCCMILGVDSEWAGWKCITSSGIGFWWKEGGGACCIRRHRISRDLNLVIAYFSEKKKHAFFVFQAGSGAHPTFYPIGTRGSYPRG
jgi:hypothetical protein